MGNRQSNVTKASSSFEQLPEPVLQNIASYMAPADLIQLSAVSKTANVVATNQQIWAGHMKRKFPENPLSASGGARIFGVRIARNMKKAYGDEVSRRVGASKLADSERQREARFFCLCWPARVLEGPLFPLALWSFIATGCLTLCLSLDQTNTISLRSCVPWIFGAFFFVALMGGLCFWRKFHQSASDRFVVGLRDGLSRQFTSRQDGSTFVYHWVQLVLFALWILLMSLRASGTAPQLPWPVAFLPFWLLIASIPCMGFLSDYRADAVFLASSGTFPFIAASILFAVKLYAKNGLDPSYLPMKYLLIPIWIVLGGVIIFGLATAADTNSGDKYLICMGLFCLVALPTVFTILLELRVDNVRSIPWLVVFIPLWFSLCACGCIAAVFAKHEWSSRDHDLDRAIEGLQRAREQMAHDSNPSQYLV